MPAIPLGEGIYDRTGLPPIMLQNMYYERAPTNTKDQVSLISRPGLKKFADLNDGPVRGIYQQDGTRNGEVFVVSGTTLFRVSALTGGVVNIGTIEGDGPVSIAGQTKQILISNGEKLYKYSNTLTEINRSFMDDDDAVWVTYYGGRFIVVRGETQRFYWTDVGTTTFGALNYASAEAFPDDLDAVWPVQDFLYMSSSSSMEVWSVSGNADLPFQRNRGKIYEQGSANKWAIARRNEFLFWVGTDSNVYELSLGLISNNAIAEQIKKGSPADLRGWTYAIDGHVFYVLNTTQMTLAYDITTQKWCRFASSGTPLNRFRVVNSANLAGRPIMGDALTGVLWQFDTGASNDNGDALVREWTGLLSTTMPQRVDVIGLDCTVGQGDLDDTPNPQVGMSISDDGDGEQWSSMRFVRLGTQGQYLKVPNWTRNGTMTRKGWVILWRYSDDRPLTVKSAFANERIR